MIDPAKKPVRKVAAGGLGGAVSVLALWGIDDLGGVDVPSTVASAITLIVTFGVAYLVPGADRPAEE